jgi:hypothetical protein
MSRKQLPKIEKLSENEQAFLKDAAVTSPTVNSLMSSRDDGMFKPPAEKEASIRFTVDIPKSLHKRLTLAAVNAETTKSDLVRQLLEKYLPQ